MSPSFSLFYMIFCISSIQQNVINGQSEQIIYTFDFNGTSGWTINNVLGTANILTPSEDLHCDGLGGSSCLQLTGEIDISRVIPTSNYHTIRVQIGT